MSPAITLHGTTLSSHAYRVEPLRMLRSSYTYRYAPTPAAR